MTKSYYNVLCSLHVHQQMQTVNIFVGFYSIVLSTWNFEYALQLYKKISFHYLRHHTSFFEHWFHMTGLLNMIYTVLK